MAWQLGPSAVDSGTQSAPPPHGNVKRSPCATLASALFLPATSSKLPTADKQLDPSPDALSGSLSVAASAANHQNRSSAASGCAPSTNAEIPRDAPSGDCEWPAIVLAPAYRPPRQSPILFLKDESKIRPPISSPIPAAPTMRKCVFCMEFCPAKTECRGRYGTCTSAADEYIPAQNP